MPDITVLGAASPAGRLLLDRLASAGANVTALARTRPPADGPSTVRWLTADATRVDALAPIVGRADVVITLVAASRGAIPGTVRSDATRALLVALASTSSQAHLLVVSAFGGSGSRHQQSRPAQWIYRRTVGAERLAEVDLQEELIADSGRPATVIRPPRLDERPATGYRVTSDRVPASGRLHRADLAHCLTDLAIAPPPSDLRFLTVVST